MTAIPQLPPLTVSAFYEAVSLLGSEIDRLVTENARLIELNDTLTRSREAREAQLRADIATLQERIKTADGQTND